ALRLDAQEEAYILLGFAQGLAHGRLAGGPGLEPDGELDLLVDQAACAVGHLADPNLHAQRVVGELADRDHGLSGKGPAERRRHAASVANDADVKKVSNAVGLGALEHEVLQ